MYTRARNGVPHTSAYVSIRHSIHLYVLLPIYIYIFPSIYPSIYLSIYPSIYLSISISIYSIYLSISISIYTRERNSMGTSYICTCSCQVLPSNCNNKALSYLKLLVY